tara:strand:+ start:230 stop:604 length:375 start_codon:yes stop_codon:yes gene_type:complete
MAKYTKKVKKTTTSESDCNGLGDLSLSSESGIESCLEDSSMLELAIELERCKDRLEMALIFFSPNSEPFHIAECEGCYKKLREYFNYARQTRILYFEKTGRDLADYIPIIAMHHVRKMISKQKE